MYKGTIEQLSTIVTISLMDAAQRPEKILKLYVDRIKYWVAILDVSRSLVLRKFFEDDYNQDIEKDFEFLDQRKMLFEHPFVSELTV